MTTHDPSTRAWAIYTLRGVAKDLMDDHHEGIATLVYYCAELLDSFRDISIDVARKATSKCYDAQHPVAMHGPRDGDRPSPF